MTVEALLEKLRSERIGVIVDVGIYQCKAQECALRGDRDLALVHAKTSEECKEKAARLHIAIEEIEKRVS